MGSKPVKRKLRALMQDALALSGRTIEELGKDTGLGRQAVGRIVRGETRRLAPDQANALVIHLPVTMAQLLEACGYNIGRGDDVPASLKIAWPQLSPEIQRAILQLAEAGVRISSASRGSETGR